MSWNSHSWLLDKVNLAGSITVIQSTYNVNRRLQVCRSCPRAAVPRKPVARRSELLEDGLEHERVCHVSVKHTTACKTMTLCMSPQSVHGRSSANCAGGQPVRMLVYSTAYKTIVM